MTRVLIADSDADVVDVLREAFEQAGCECITAFDGATALARARTERPALVVLDATLPGRDGRDICRGLRATSEGASRPLTMLMAATTGFDEALDVTVGADDFVRKPFSVTEVVDRARRLLQWHGRWAVGGPWRPSEDDRR